MAAVPQVRRGEDCLRGVRHGVGSLLERCRAGEQGAWDELVTRYERLVFSVCRREGLGVEDAADATQTAFEALLDSMSQIRDDQRLAAWLVAVARRHAWRIRNATRRHRPLDDTGTGDPLRLEDTTGDIDRALWLYDALQDLGEPCRSMITALYFEDPAPTYADVAARLQRPVGSIGPTRARCLARLRTILESDEP